MAKLNLEKLIKDPFGPFADALVLNQSFRSGSTRPVFVLTDVKLSANQQPIGLDTTEYLLPPVSNVPTANVRFSGILHVRDLKWLSAEGRDIIQEKLRQRDMQTNGVASSGLTLAGLYGSRPGEGSHIHIHIRCKKFGDAMYKTTIQHPNDLILQSSWPKTNSRSYIIGLSASAEQRSQLFIERWELYHMIHQLSKDDGTPVYGRTVKWLAQKALEKYQQQAVVDGYVLPQGPGPVIHDPEPGRKIAAHAEWLLAQHMVSRDRRHKFLSGVDWYKFCQKVKRDPGLWNMRFENNRVDFTVFGGTTNDWNRRLMKLPSEATRAQHQPLEGSDGEEPLSRETSPFPEAHKTGATLLYDPEFSEASTPNASGSDYESEPEGAMELLKLVPPFCRRRPEIPQGTFIWRCPGCTFEIDMLNLKPDNVEGVDEDLIEYINGREWCNLSEPRVHSGFLQMASLHYNEHLRDSHVWLYQKRGKAALAPWPPPAEPAAYIDEDDDDLEYA